jgi:hypothetical protein
MAGLLSSTDRHRSRQRRPSGTTSKVDEAGWERDGHPCREVDGQLLYNVINDLLNDTIDKRL